MASFLTAQQTKGNEMVEKCQLERSVSSSCYTNTYSRGGMAPLRQVFWIKRDSKAARYIVVSGWNRNYLKIST